MNKTMKRYSLEEGRKLVKAARHAIELYIRSPHFSNSVVEEELGGFDEECGVFVTIEHYPTKELRGCIGFTRAVGPLYKSLVEAAIAAATEDPRFVPVSHLEFEHMTVEVSILTNPERLTGTAKEIEKRVVVGRDGLIIEYGYYSGLLLPIVAVEQGWDSRRFLDEVCVKAGLSIETWKRSDAHLYRFTTQVFRETEPYGEVTEVKLG